MNKQVRHSNAGLLQVCRDDDGAPVNTEINELCEIPAAYGNDEF